MGTVTLNNHGIMIDIVVLQLIFITVDVALNPEAVGEVTVNKLQWNPSKEGCLVARIDGDHLARIVELDGHRGPGP